MATRIRNVQTTFAPNRAEEYGDDVWNEYVVPPFFDQLDLFTAKKPRVIIGGRGCGKTMLLKYLSHSSWFSKKRKLVTSEDLKHIGIYWRVQTHIATSMSERGLKIDQWQAAFEHYAAVELSIEVLNALASLLNYKNNFLEKNTIESIDFSPMQDYSKSLPKNFNKLIENLNTRKREFERWLNNIRKVEEPEFFPGYQFVRELIKTIIKQVPAFSESTYFIYLDEYENLLEYQQLLVNTWLKHSESPLIANLAVKRNAFTMRKTLGGEQLVDIHDFRILDLESYYLNSGDFEFFAAEIVLQKLQNSGIKKLPTEKVDLRDIRSLLSRRDEKYRKRVLLNVTKVFPSISAQNLAQEVMTDKILSDRLLKRIGSALKNRGSRMKAKDFLMKAIPAASVVAAPLLYRSKLTPKEILDEMILYKQKKEGRFEGNGGWIANNLVGSLLLLFEPLNRACPLYSGFDTFCQLSKGNIRHLLELCYKSLSMNDVYIKQGLPFVSPNIQAEASRQVSSSLLPQIRVFGRYGNKLYSFVLRLGSLFHVTHLNPSQSEPEQNHFSIVGGKAKIEDDDTQFLMECTKWSVLFEEKQTKKKHSYQQETVEYVINPIYAPYFHISYRKRKKIELTTDEYLCLTKGTYEEFEKLLESYSKRWSIKTSESSLPLFSEMNMRKKK